MSFKGPFIHSHSHRYLGTSADGKPSRGVALNSRFYETDTGKTYIYDGSWTEETQLQYVVDPNTLDIVPQEVGGGGTGSDVNVTNDSIAVTGPLTDTQLRASDVKVTLDGEVAATNLDKARDSAAGAADIGVIALGKMVEQSAVSSVSDGDYEYLSLTDMSEVRTRDQRNVTVQACNDSTQWAALNNDTVNIADSANHVFGTKAVTFDKANGTANTVFACITDTITSVNVSRLMTAGGAVGMMLYLSSLSNVVRAFVRLGTDASNYNQWSWEVASLAAGEWMALRTPCSQPHYSKNTGNGWNPAAITYVAAGVEFDQETRTLAGIIVDHIHVVGSRVTDTDITSTITSSVNTPNININRVGGSSAATNNGTATAGTLRVTVASDSTGVLKEVRPATSAVTQVASSASNTTLQASNANRLGLTVFNDSTQALYVKYGTTASASDFTVKIAAGGYFEAPFPCYTGRVDGIWASANGNAYITETSA
jgi:hypothetical protein